MYEAGITTPGDFGIPELMRWNIVTGESRDSPDFDVEKGVDVILQRKADIQERRTGNSATSASKPTSKPLEEYPGSPNLHLDGMSTEMETSSG